MKTTKIILVACLFFFAACGKSPDSEVVDTPVVEKSEVGPFDVAFKPSDGTYEHSFKININQDEGKVEYFILTAEKKKINFVSTKLTVTGCPAAQVVHHVFWLPDANSGQGIMAMPGLSFETVAQTKGVFLHVLKGLTGCSAVELNTVLQRAPGLNSAKISSKI